MRAVWGVARDLRYPVGAAYLLGLATGQRLSEIVGLPWWELDLEQRIWELPRQRNKSDRDHTVPLSSLAMEILQGVPWIGPFVFSYDGVNPSIWATSGAKRVGQCRRREIKPILPSRRRR
jgi:integrase